MLFMMRDKKQINAPEGELSTKVLCPICSQRFGVCRDSESCLAHSKSDQIKFEKERREFLRNIRQINKEKFMDPSNQLLFAKWAEGLQKIK